MSNSIEAVWKTVREIKVDDIRKASLKPLKVALIGGEDDLTWLQSRFCGNSSAPGDLRRATDTLLLFETPVPADCLDAINACAFVCATPTAAGDLQTQRQVVKAPLYTIGSEGEWSHFTLEVLDTRADLHLALSRNLPGLRPHIVDYIVTNTACVNAEVAVISAAAASIPGIGPIYPGIAFGDTVILTKNQVMMAFRLAGACGLSIDIVHLKGEVLAIIGGGLGWRTLAREMVGALPVLGIPLKGAVAYAGTYAVGVALARYFTTGSRLSRSEEQAVYQKAMQRGRAVAADALSRVKRKARFRRAGHKPDHPQTPEPHSGTIPAH